MSLSKSGDCGGVKPARLQSYRIQDDGTRSVVEAPELGQVSGRTCRRRAVARISNARETIRPRWAGVSLCYIDTQRNDLKEL